MWLRRVCLHLDALELEKPYLMTAVSGSFLFPATPNQQNRIFIRTRGIPEEPLSYLENTWQEGGWKCVIGVYYICQVPSASVGDTEMCISLLYGTHHSGQRYSRIIESEGMRGQFFISQSCCSTLWDRITSRDPGARKSPFRGCV